MGTGTSSAPSGSGTVTSVKLSLVSAPIVQRTGHMWLPGRTSRQPFSSSHGSSAIQAAMQVPGWARR
jgi:hypothetical protein